MYNKSTFFYVDRLIKNTSLSLMGTTVIIFLSLFLAYNTLLSRLFLAFFIVFCFIFLNIQKLCILRYKNNSIYKTKVIYVGEEALYENFRRYTFLSGFNFDILGYINIDDKRIDSVECLGSLNDFEKILRATPCDEIVFTQALSRKNQVDSYIALASEMGIISRVILDVYDIVSAKWYVSSLGTYPMITYYNVTLDPSLLALKRVIDIIGAFIGILVFSPIMVITAVMIKISSPGPVIFKQVRIGQHGQRFHIYKFRSMCIDAEAKITELMSQNEMSDGKIFKIKNDPRITKVGKFIRKTSIDELPQFFNVLIGQMSLVGTRPPTENEVEQYDLRHYRRISIKPGITGIWQTSGRNEITDFEQIVKMDIEYIEKWSLFFDFWLLCKTVIVLFDKNGAY